MLISCFTHSESISGHAALFVMLTKLSRNLTVSALHNLDKANESQTAVVCNHFSHGPFPLQHFSHNPFPLQHAMLTIFFHKSILPINCNIHFLTWLYKVFKGNNVFLKTITFLKTLGTFRGKREIYIYSSPLSHMTLITLQNNAPFSLIGGWLRRPHFIFM